MNKIKQLLLLLALTSCQTYLFAQIEYDQFLSAFRLGDTVRMEQAIIKWKAKTSDNPDLYLCEFNYHFYCANNTIYNLTEENSNSDSLTFVKANGDFVYLKDESIFNTSHLNAAEKALNIALNIYPNRLDIRYGLISFYQKTKNWGKFTDEVIKTLEHSKLIDNNWLWTKNTTFYGGKNSFLSGLDEFQAELFSYNEDALLSHMRVIAQETIVFYPQHIQAYLDVAVTYLLIEQYDESISFLQKAEKIEPKNQIVLGNLAYVYKLSGDKNMALIYYNKVQKVGDKEHAAFARQQIAKLN